MESLKEKNKKNARRCGMNKKELLSLALAGAGILGLAAGNVIAGMSVITQTVALERIPASSDAKTDKYDSRDIIVDGILAANGTKITLKLDNGFFKNGTHIALCESGKEPPAANGTVRGDNATVELTAQTDIGSNMLLRLVSNETAAIDNCTRTNNWVPVLIKGGLNDGDEVKLTIGTYTGTLFKVKQQYTARLTKATDYIDPDKEYKQLKEGKTSSRATYYISNSTPDIYVNATNGKFAISLSGEFTGVKEAKVSSPIDSGSSFLTLNATNNWTGSNSISTFGANGTIEITVTGTDTLTPRTFKVSLRTVPNTGGVEREIYLLKDVVSHEWLMPGVTYYIPFVVVRPNEETWIVLQAKKGATQSSYKVNISALDDNGEFKSIDSITMNAGDRLVLKASSDIKAKIPTLTKDRFVVMINVENADDTQIFAYANICRSDGFCRRVPVKAKNGRTSE
ncbi:MAG: hypothetical protein LM575_05815 [Caldimicrobium sp.]|nr:hypothetical protein [Caldimicrobium sp.]